MCRILQQSQEQAHGCVQRNEPCCTNTISFERCAASTARARAEVYRNVKQYPSAEQHPNICVVRVDAPVYFANVEWIRSRVDKYRERASNDSYLGPCRFVVLDMAPVPFVDSTGALPVLLRCTEQRIAQSQRIVLRHAAGGCGCTAQCMAIVVSDRAGAVMRHAASAVAKQRGTSCCADTKLAEPLRRAALSPTCHALTRHHTIICPFTNDFLQ